MTKVGFKNSVGWREKLKIFIHLFAPFNWLKKKTGTIDKIKKIRKKTNEKIIIFSIGKHDVIKINKIAKGKIIKCFLIR